MLEVQPLKVEQGLHALSRSLVPRPPTVAPSTRWKAVNIKGIHRPWMARDARELLRMDGAWAFGIEATICVR